MRSLGIVLALAVSACGPAGFGTSGEDGGRASAPDSVAENRVSATAAFSADVEIVPSDEVVSGMSIPETMTATIGEDGRTVVISGTATGNQSEGKTSGVAFVFRDEDEQKIGGNKVKVKLVAKASSGTSMKVAYSTREVGNSGWHSFDLTDEFAEYSFETDVAAPIRGGNDYLGIVPVGGDVTVSAVGVDILAPLPAPDQEGEPASVGDSTPE